MSVTVVRVEGSPKERGRAVGEALAEPIHRSLAFYRGVLERQGRSTVELPTLLGVHRAAAASAYPDLIAEIDGMAEGADAPWWEVFAVNAFEELEPVLQPEAAIERCTSFAWSGAEGTVLGHNEQWYAGDAGNVAVVVAAPDRGPAFASPTVVACLPAVGMNAHGVAQGVMSMSADDDRVGIPRVLVSRSTLQAADLRDLERRATPSGRSGGYAYVVASPGHVSMVETSATRHVVRDDAAVAHTNHYVDRRLASFEVSPSEGSRARLHRVQRLLADRSPSSPEDAMGILRDHEGEPQAVCKHADDGDEEGSAVLFSMVCHLEERRMWVAAGNPCTAPYEEIDLTGVA